MSDERERIVEAMCRAACSNEEAECANCGPVCQDPETAVGTYAHQMHAALAAIEAAGYVIEQDWQPIETAPKRVNLLVAYQNRLGNWRIAKAAHISPPLHEDCEPYEGCEEVGEEWLAPSDWYEMVENDDEGRISLTEEPPTRWRPLPAAPKAEQ
jgi:hypothetical protein